jgi:hypothetical protein
MCYLHKLPFLLHCLLHAMSITGDASTAPHVKAATLPI